MRATFASTEIETKKFTYTPKDDPKEEREYAEKLPDSGYGRGKPGLTLVIGTAMVLAMMMAGVAGAAIPLILKAFGQDPAQSSSIVLTTVTDCSSFLSFLGLATLLLHFL